MKAKIAKGSGPLATDGTGTSFGDGTIRTLPDWAQRIQHAVDLSGLSQSEIARRAGLQRDAMGRYYNGRTRPPAAKLVALARVLDVDPQELDPDRRDLEGVKPADSAPPRFRMTPALGGDGRRVFLEISAELDITTAARVVEIMSEGSR